MGTGKSDRAVWRATLLGLGSNLGDRLATLRGAAARLASEPGLRGLAGSGIYESPPMGPAAQGPFLNAVLAAETSLAPRELLALMLAVEQEFGRVRDVRWGPRTLDLDVLWIDGVTVDEPGLAVPHPGLATRAFVLRPVADVAPDVLVAPGQTAAAAAKELTDDACLRLPGAALLG